MFTGSCTANSKIRLNHCIDQMCVGLGVTSTVQPTCAVPLQCLIVDAFVAEEGLITPQEERGSQKYG